MKPDSTEKLDSMKLPERKKEAVCDSPCSIGGADRFPNISMYDDAAKVFMHDKSLEGISPGNVYRCTMELTVTGVRFSKKQNGDTTGSIEFDVTAASKPKLISEAEPADEPAVETE